MMGNGNPSSSDSIRSSAITSTDDLSSSHSNSELNRPRPDPFLGNSLEEKRLVRKLDRRILPVLCLVYLFAYLDRTNLGNARLLGLPEDTLGGDPTGRLFDWANSAFFFPYILIQIPASVCAKLFPPQIWMAFATIGWGLCSTLMSAAFNFTGLVVARVGLGTFEAGFSPVAVLYLTIFYTNTEVGLRMAYWFSFAAVAGAFSGLIAFGVQHAHTFVANWRLLFIIEGIPSIVLGIACFFILPSRPESTSYLTDKERHLAIERMNRGTSGDIGAATVNKEHVWAAFRDWRIYVAGIILFGANCALASISAFLPTIIKSFGYTDALAQLLTVPPYALAAVVLTGSSYFADRIQSRGIFTASGGVIGSIGYILLITVPANQHVRYFATFWITTGTFMTIGTMIAWFAHNLGSESKKATGIPIYGVIGQCGSVLGSHIFPTTDGPRYIKGFAVSCAFEFLSALCALIISISYRLENRRRDRIYGKPLANARVDTSVLADKAPAFRYVP